TSQVSASLKEQIMIRSLNQRIPGYKAPGRTHRVLPRRNRARPALEGLEGRQLLTVTYGGGALLPKVDVQALYYGSDWNNSTYTVQKNKLEDFLSEIVDSSYMDMLNKAGYGVGRGTSDQGMIDPVSLNSQVTDSQLRTALQGDIGKGLKSPN